LKLLLDAPADDDEAVRHGVADIAHGASTAGVWKTVRERASSSCVAASSSEGRP